MSRAGAHKSLDELLDACDEAASASDLAKQAQAENDVIAAYRELMVTSGVSTAFLRRFGAAMIARTPLEPEGAGIGAIELAQRPITPEDLKNPDGAVMVRRGLARIIEDALEPFLTRGITIFIAKALLDANTGRANTWLSKPYRMQGTKQSTSPERVRDFLQLSVLHYEAGHRGVSIKDAAAVFLPHEPNRLKALEQTQRRHKWTEYMKQIREKGARDKTAGVYAAPAAGYDFSEIERLTRMP